MCHTTIVGYAEGQVGRKGRYLKGKGYLRPAFAAPNAGRCAQACSWNATCPGFAYKGDKPWKCILFTTAGLGGYDKSQTDARYTLYLKSEQCQVPRPACSSTVHGYARGEPGKKGLFLKGDGILGSWVRSNSVQTCAAECDNSSECAGIATKAVNTKVLCAHYTRAGAGGRLNQGKWKFHLKSGECAATPPAATAPTTTLRVLDDCSSGNMLKHFLKPVAEKIGRRKAQLSVSIATASPRGCAKLCIGLLLCAAFALKPPAASGGSGSRCLLYSTEGTVPSPQNFTGSVFYVMRDRARCGAVTTPVATLTTPASDASQHLLTHPHPRTLSPDTSTPTPVFSSTVHGLTSHPVSTAPSATVSQAPPLRATRVADGIAAPNRTAHSVCGDPAVPGFEQAQIGNKGRFLHGSGVVRSLGTASVRACARECTATPPCMGIAYKASGTNATASQRPTVIPGTGTRVWCMLHTPAGVAGRQKGSGWEFRLNLQNCT